MTAIADIVKPGTLDIDIYAGDSFSRLITVKQGGVPIDLTGFTAKAQIRAGTDGRCRVLAEFTTAIVHAAGEITISLTPTQTRAMSRGGLWDLEVQDGGDTEHKTILTGKARYTRDVTA